MDLLVELALDHPTMPAAEARALLAVLGGTFVRHAPGILLATAPESAWRPFAARAALAHAVDEPWAEAEAPSGLGIPLARRDLGGRSFAVRPRRIEGRFPDEDLPALARSLGAALATTGRVDLEKPEVEVRVLLSDRAYAGRLLAEVDRAAFERRHVRHRPFFSPVTLHPRWARALVNLARVEPGHRVLDPFCGTGGIALEAALAGARVHASDLDPRMVAGTRATLDHFGAESAVVEERDVGEAPEFARGVDAVVTDPPYGRSATTAREEADRLYDRFFAASAAALREGGYLVAGFPSRAPVEARRAGLVLEEAHDVRVHRSLTRTFAVWRRERARNNAYVAPAP